MKLSVSASIHMYVYKYEFFSRNILCRRELVASHLFFPLVEKKRLLRYIVDFTSYCSISTETQKGMESALVDLLFLTICVSQ